MFYVLIYFVALFITKQMIMFKRYFHLLEIYVTYNIPIAEAEPFKHTQILYCMLEMIEKNIHNFYLKKTNI